jgi:hypothetical protein
VGVDVRGGEDRADSAPPILFGGIRSVLGGAVMVVLAFARSGLPDLRDTWLAYVVLTLLNVVLFFGLQTLAISSSRPGWRPC